MVKINIKYFNFMIIEILYIMLDFFCFRRFLLIILCKFWDYCRIWLWKRILIIYYFFLNYMYRVWDFRRKS